MKTIQWSGYWEQKNRSIIAAAVLALLGVGYLYFFSQSALFVAGMFIDWVIKSLEGSTSTLQISDFDTGLQSLDGLFAEYKYPILIALIISQYVFMFLPIYLLIKFWHTKQIFTYARYTIPKRPFFFYEILFAVVGIFLLLPTIGYLEHFITYYVIRIPKELTDMQFGLLQSHSLPEFLFLVFTISITPCICEEFFFRGYIQRTLERKIGWVSILITGILFGLFHFNPLGLLVLSLLGVFMGYLFYRSKSIYPSMVAHFTNNFLILFIIYFQPEIFGFALLKEDLVPVPILIGSIFLFILMVWIYEALIRKADRETQDHVPSTPLETPLDSTMV